MDTLTSSKSRTLLDVRYFESAEPPSKWHGPPGSAGELFVLPKVATSLGQRIGKKCGELGYSIGNATHLYLCFTNAIPEKSITITNNALAPWHRFVAYGLSSDFNNFSDELKLSILVDATFNVMEKIGSLTIASRECLKRDVLNESLLLFVKSKQTSKYDVTIYQTVPVFPQQAEVFAHVKKNKTGEEKRVKIGGADFYLDVPDFVDRISLSRETLTIFPRKSKYLNLQLPAVNLEQLFKSEFIETTKN